MLTQEELTRLLADLESDRIERTQSTTDTDKFAEAVCAFANDLPNHGLPGYLVIGVNNQGAPVGLSVTDQLLLTLAALRSSGNIQPMPALVVVKMSLPGGDVAVVEVLPSDMPPVRYKGRVCIRVGPRKGVASEQEERILTERRIAHAHSYDASPVLEASISDLALPLFAAYRQEVVAADIIAENHRSMEDQLASLRFYNNRNGHPTVGGILLFGSNPRFFLPGAYVQFLRLPGTSLTERPLDQAELSGDLLSVLRELDGRVKNNLQFTLESVSPLKEKLVSDYPEVALRELLLNAIMHRDYQSNTPARLYWFADRIEISNPGGLFGEVTQDTLTRRSSYRNPVIAEAMKALGYANRFGYGIQRAQAALQESGNPAAEFEIDDRSFLVVIRRRPQ